MLINLLLFFTALAGMESVAYLTHRYIMHGPLWNLHESHHVDHEGHLERNDWFAVFFALPSIVLIYFGTNGHPRLLWVGLGIAAYGALYFAFHDLIVHRRIDLGVRPKGRYMRRIIAAHHIHHNVKVRDGASSFGFLYAPPVEKLKTRAKRPAPREPAS